jgi:nicotinate-nucleotide adenylyltransferase
LNKYYIYFKNNNDILEVALLNGELPNLKCHENGSEYKLTDHSSTSAVFIQTDLYKTELSWTSLEQLKELPMPQGAFICEALAHLWSCMPNALETSLKLPNWIRKNNSKESAVFFGGSFNPWHEGHQECIEQCPEANLIIVPDFNPWKEKKEDECAFTSFKNLCEKFKGTSYSIYPGFWGREKANPTIDWIPKVKYQKKALLIGDDNFLSFKKWKDYQSLLSELDSLYVVPRQHSQDSINNMKSELLSEVECEINILKEHDYQDISSTKIRNRI